MKKILLTLLLSTIIYSQQQVDIPWPTLADSPWSMMSHDPQATGRSPYVGPKTAVVKWTLDLPYGVLSGPIIGEDGTLYAGTNSYLGFTGDTTNYFYAIAKDGEIKWTFLTGTPYSNESGYLINNEGTIFFGSQSGWLYAIDQDGNLKWKYDTGGNIYQITMNTDLQGNIYITNATGFLYSFSKDGQLNWKKIYGNRLFPHSVTISPDGKTLYIVGDNRIIYALNLDGSIKSSFQCVGVSRQPLLVDNSGNIYFVPSCTLPKSIKSVDSAGVLRWEYVINNGEAYFSESSPAMDYEGNIYYTYGTQIGSDFSRIESVDYYGNYRWTYQFEQLGEVILMPLVVDKEGTIYCGSTYGYYYYAISSEGELLWKLPLDGYQVDNSGAIGSDGTLYIGTHLGSLAIGQEKTLMAIRDTVTSIKNNDPGLFSYHLEQNFPNPFNSTTRIKYTIPESGRVTLAVYDLLGKKVVTLLERYQGKGSYDLIFQADDLASGIYFYQLQAGEFRATKKLILLK
jgi:outer membrane protein assembly factor BamB